MASYRRACPQDATQDCILPPLWMMSEQPSRRPLVSRPTSNSPHPPASSVSEIIIPPRILCWAPTSTGPVGSASGYAADCLLCWAWRSTGAPRGFGQEIEEA